MPHIFAGLTAAANAIGAFYISQNLHLLFQFAFAKKNQKLLALTT